MIKRTVIRSRFCKSTWHAYLCGGRKVSLHRLFLCVVTTVLLSALNYFAVPTAERITVTYLGRVAA